MAFKDLRDFLTFIEKKGQLKRISAPVDRDLEITEISDRIMKSGGPALLFENVRGFDVPLVINVFGSRERTGWALGVDAWEELEGRIDRLLSLALGPPPKGLFGKLGALGEIIKVGRIGPKEVSSGPCQEIVKTDDASLYEFPIMKCWPEDAGHYITLPLVFTHDPNTGKRNVGLYRLQVFDERTLGMHWQLHKGGMGHYKESVRAGKRMEIAVAVGSEPVLTYAATAPLPPEIDEMVFAGFLREKSVEMVRCKTVDVLAPANAEIVIEGYVDPSELRTEGPFGDHTGVYSLADEYPVLHVTAITHRRNPIYASTIVGKPPMEDAFIGGATERLFLPLIRLMVPELVDIHLPVDSVFHNFAIASIRKRYPGQARKVMHAIWGLGQLMFTKFVIVVDENVDVQNLREVLWRVGNNTDPARDIEIAKGPADTLEHASPQPNYGGKIGIDATIKMPEEGHHREWPPDIVMTQEIKDLVDGRWEEYGF
ncbi:MAG: menaquinone biosynthesis decarboxylase [Chloroflexi bacterium]|nr:menaquinone biosynthesis decarboxylase [Chloroflexota bacterium]MCY3938783.1 menaquinone biosynthesis decarboxylase [Chloroflexota bacterium]